MSELTIEQIIGDPKRLDTELQEFRRSAKLLSSRRVDLIAKYAKRWIAIYDRQVRADGSSLNQLLAKVDQLQVPRDRVVIRYIDRNLRRMIL
jgi:hypothetical protein